MVSKKNVEKHSAKISTVKATTLSVPKLHARNLHQGRYDLSALSQCAPSLKPFVKSNVEGNETIDFNDPKAVLSLNQALLAYYYHVELWQIPEGYLCPPIPGRADYIHYLADLLATANNGEVPRGKQTRVLDVGCGANCIYPIIGSQSYGWKFVGTDIDLIAVNCAKNIVKSNASLKNNIKLLHQRNAGNVFKDVIKPDEYFDLTMCNPPFYESMQQAQENNQRKQNNLIKSQMKRRGHSYPKSPYQDRERNFGGQNTELWCQGGELKFVTRMAEESVLFKDQVTWFSSLLSKQENVSKLQEVLKRLGANDVSVIKMAQGNKMSRFIAWKF